MLSYWQKGCDDAKAKAPFNVNYRYKEGYANGYYYGRFGCGRIATWEVPSDVEVRRMSW